MDPHVRNIKYSDLLPSGLTDYLNDNVDSFLNMLDQNDIDYIDLREQLGYDEHNIDTFFRTDHHWRPEMGLWAADIIRQQLSDEYGFVVDDGLYDIKNLDRQHFLLQIS